jgi:pyridoxamine 5'-phosphate oxidase
VASHPVNRFNRWLREARAAGAPLAEACALATADGRARPSVRYVLLKKADEDGFVFYTNTLSRKGRELAENPYASLAFYWDATGRQVRVEGRTKAVTIAEAEEYWAERPLASRLASAASNQSETMKSRTVLISMFKELARACKNGEIARPPEWSGYRIVPSSIEFWIRNEPRLHNRELFELRGGAWHKSLLQPAACDDAAVDFTIDQDEAAAVVVAEIDRVGHTLGIVALFDEIDLAVFEGRRHGQLLLHPHEHRSGIGCELLGHVLVE